MLYQGAKKQGTDTAPQTQSWTCPHFAQPDDQNKKYKQMQINEKGKLIAPQFSVRFRLI